MIIIVDFDVVCLVVGLERILPPENVMDNMTEKLMMMVVVVVVVVKTGGRLPEELL